MTISAALVLARAPALALWAEMLAVVAVAATLSAATFLSGHHFLLLLLGFAPTRHMSGNRRRLGQIGTGIVDGAG